MPCKVGEVQGCIATNCPKTPGRVLILVSSRHTPFHLFTAPGSLATGDASEGALMRRRAAIARGEPGIMDGMTLAFAGKVRHGL